MAIHDLDKIVLHKTVIGINCPECGGQLQAVSPARSWLQRLLFWRRFHRYRCLKCLQFFQMSSRR